MKNYPLISCLCVTKMRSSLKTAINCFLNQTYPNKELIVVYEHGAYIGKEIPLAHSKDWSIFFIEVPANDTQKLGYLRNIAVGSANGDFVCQWDDDDWYHENRLAFQYESIRGTNFAGSILKRVLLYDTLKRIAAISSVRTWEGSILCDREVISKKPYDNIHRGEDTPVVDFLSSQKSLYGINNMPHLYIYNYHGENTFEQTHFSKLFFVASTISSSHSDQITDIVQQKTAIAEGSAILNGLFPTATKTK